ncbi:hypothetical protein NKG94_27315 [Micromonospora sp. M12]
MAVQAPLVDAANVIRTAVERAPARGYAGIGLVDDHVTLWWKGAPPTDIAAAVTAARRTAPVEVANATYSRTELRKAAARLTPWWKPTRRTPATRSGCAPTAPASRSPLTTLWAPGCRSYRSPASVPASSNATGWSNGHGPTTPRRSTAERASGSPRPGVPQASAYATRTPTPVSSSPPNTAEPSARPGTSAGTRPPAPAPWSATRSTATTTTTR